MAFINQHPAVRRWIVALAHLRARHRLHSVFHYLSNARSLLDVGAGMGLVAERLGTIIPRVVALDIENLTFTKEVDLVLYNGHRMPFPDQRFDLSLLLGVLHHIEYQEEVLCEVRRVSRNAIVMEDLYSTPSQRWWVHSVDQVLNGEWPSPKKYFRTDKEWKRIFRSLGFKLTTVFYERTLWGVPHGFYVLATDRF